MVVTRGIENIVYYLTENARFVEGILGTCCPHITKNNAMLLGCLVQVLIPMMPLAAATPACF